MSVGCSDVSWAKLTRKERRPAQTSSESRSWNFADHAFTQFTKLYTVSSLRSPSHICRSRRRAIPRKCLERASTLEDDHYPTDSLSQSTTHRHHRAVDVPLPNAAQDAAKPGVSTLFESFIVGRYTYDVRHVGSASSRPKPHGGPRCACYRVKQHRGRRNKEGASAGKGRCLVSGEYDLAGANETGGEMRLGCKGGSRYGGTSHLRPVKKHENILVLQAVFPRVCTRQQGRKTGLCLAAAPVHSIEHTTISLYTS